MIASSTLRMKFIRNFVKLDQLGIVAISALGAKFSGIFIIGLKDNEVLGIVASWQFEVQLIHDERLGGQCELNGLGQVLKQLVDAGNVAVDFVQSPHDLIVITMPSRMCTILARAGPRAARECRVTRHDALGLCMP